MKLLSITLLGIFYFFGQSERIVHQTGVVTPVEATYPYLQLAADAEPESKALAEELRKIVS